ncbi:MAG: GGDEF domain-containing protein [Cyanobacteriota bacterium]
MEKVVVITPNELDEQLEKVLKTSENYEYNVADLDNLKSLNDENYSLAIIDAPTDSIDNIVTKLSLSIPLLFCVEDENAPLEWRNREFDVVYKPFKNKELEIRIANILKIKILKDEVNRISLCDDLTGLYNRKHLLDRLEEELSRSKRYATPITCMLMDVDYFKVINDMYGYQVGDEVLKKISDILLDRVRKEDIVTRYGDEEFIVALPNTTDRNAYVLAERIRKDIKAFNFFQDEEEPMSVTVSIGISTYPFPHMEPDVNTLTRYAEHALYNAKKQGKNKVVLFSQINFDF